MNDQLSVRITAGEETSESDARIIKIEVVNNERPDARPLLVISIDTRPGSGSTTPPDVERPTGG